jgi:hypothetical protein
MSSILEQIGAAVKLKFNNDKQSDDKKLAEISDEFTNLEGQVLPLMHDTQIQQAVGSRNEAIASSNSLMHAYTADLNAKKAEVESLFTDDDIINSLSELKTKLDEEGEELNERISEYNNELASIAAERKAYFGWDEAIVVAAMSQITESYA